MAAAPLETAYGFPRRRRLRRRRDFVRVQRTGARGATDALVVLLRPGPGRAGLAVSRKVGNAVVRNRLKRRLRHLLRTHKAWFKGRDAVLILRPGAGELSFAVLHEKVETAFARAEEALAEKGTQRGGRGKGRRGSRKGPRSEKK